MKAPWRRGNRVQLLEDGDEFFPRVFAAMRAAETEILLETFIISDDEVGHALREELIAATARGVTVAVTADGFGTGELPATFIAPLTAAGVRFHLFNPASAPLGMYVNLLRRMHRKIVVIDGRIAFVGGINFIADQLADSGAVAKRDYSAELEGPIVVDIHAFVIQTLRHPRRQAYQPQSRPPQSHARNAGSADVLFVTRDNRLQPSAIEHHYRLGIRTATKQLIIANAYFLPGYRLLWRLRQAARRGVDVKLILQGNPDFITVQWATRSLYRYLAGAGVQIFEYTERQLHGKVAIADDEWSTIGSSNLDPLSLSMNLEANVFVRDADFNAALRERLTYLLENHCQRVDIAVARRSHWWDAALSSVIFHFLRHFPRWASSLPRHRVVLKKMHTEAVLSEK